MAREENIRIFEDTVDFCKKISSLRESIKFSRDNQVFIAENDSLADGASNYRFEDEAKIIVSKKRTFEAAETYAKSGYKTAVLNFASSSNPGGGVVNGAGAQEECLCRISTLYFTLDTDENWSRFYKPHRQSKNPLHNDDILYSPEITIFKSDTQKPESLPENEWFKADVITCAAPNLRERPSNLYNTGDGNTKISLTNTELKRLHQKRDRRIFNAAVQNKADALILGAFGCGAFCNDPTTVADVMLSLAKEYTHEFKVIEFAVYCPPFDDTNFRIFESFLKHE